jgi:hypothetical protein
MALNVWATPRGGQHERGTPYKNPPRGCTAANPESDDPIPW